MGTFMQKTDKQKKFKHEILHSWKLNIQKITIKDERKSHIFTVENRNMICRSKKIYIFYFRYIFRTENTGKNNDNKMNKIYVSEK